MVLYLVTDGLLLFVSMHDTKVTDDLSSSWARVSIRGGSFSIESRIGRGLALKSALERQLRFYFATYNFLTITVVASFHGSA